MKLSLKNFKDKALHNLGYKVISVILAIILWILAKSELIFNK